MTTPLTEPGTQAGAETPPGTDDWRAVIPEDLRSDPSLASFKDAGALAKSYVETKRMVGGAIQVPKDTDPPEAWEKLYAKIRPEKPENYDLKPPEGANGAWDEGMATAFKSAAHQNGLHPRQAQGLLDWYTKVQNERVAAFTKEMEAGMATLKTEWGAGYDKRMGFARKAVDGVGGEELKKVLDSTGLGNHPVLVKVFAEIGEAMEEDHPPQGEGRASTESADAIQKQLDAIFADPKDPFTNATAPHEIHERRVKEVQDLLRRLAEAKMGVR